MSFRTPMPMPGLMRLPSIAGFRTASLANDRSGKGAVHSLEGAAEGLQVLPWLFAYQCQPDVSAFV